jgi:arsenite-transporting ATPase
MELQGGFEPFSVLLEGCPGLVMFTGKGGVGKTTCAAAAAIALADSGKRTLLLSTDPAHSVSDSLGEAVGPRIREIPSVPRLWAVEIDAGAALAEFRSRFGEDLHELLASVTYLDEEDTRLLLGLDLPGLDELMGLHQICGFLSEEPRRFEHLVWDSAPTGHTLRLLELPHLIDHWVKVMAGITWKYRDLLPSVLMDPDRDEDDILLLLKRTIRTFVRMVTDAKQSRLIPVTIPEPMAGAETLRLIARLQQLRIPIHYTVINGLIPSSPGCHFCCARHRAMKGYLRELESRLNPLRLVGLPARPAPVRGVQELRAIRSQVPPLV